MEKPGKAGIYHVKGSIQQRWEGRMPGSLRTEMSQNVESESRPGGSYTSSSFDRFDEPAVRAFGWENRLAQAIVSIVIPKLQNAHPSVERKRETSAVRDMRLQTESDRFIGMVLAESRDAQWQFLCELRQAGLDPEAIFLDVMTPAIRHLGDLWEDDRMSFIDVTTKSSHLQQMMRRLGAEWQTQGSHCGNRRILLAPAPGEQHTFGLFLLAEMFLKAGWDTIVEPSTSLANLCDCVRLQSYDAIGLSAGSERSLATIAACVHEIRSAACKVDMRVFLGGWAFQTGLTSLDAYGADMVETDAREAVQKANMLCPLGDGAVQSRY